MIINRVNAMSGIRGAVRIIFREYRRRIRRRLNAGRKTLQAWAWEEREDILVFLGWASVTTGISFVPWFNPWAVWAVSAGLVALSLVGWAPIGLIALRGLAALERASRREQQE